MPEAMPLGKVIVLEPGLCCAKEALNGLGRMNRKVRLPLMGTLVASADAAIFL